MSRKSSMKKKPYKKSSSIINTLRQGDPYGLFDDDYGYITLKPKNDVVITPPKKRDSKGFGGSGGGKIEQKQVSIDEMPDLDNNVVDLDLDNILNRQRQRQSVGSKVRTGVTADGKRSKRRTTKRSKKSKKHFDGRKRRKSKKSKKSKSKKHSDGRKRRKSKKC